MNMPNFAGEASLYRTSHHYRTRTGGSALSTADLSITPQACGFVKGAVCGTAIAGGTVLCTSACFAGPAACVGCWTGALAIVGFGFCRDCIPAWMRAIIDAFGGGGGGGGSGGGGGGGGGGSTTCCPFLRPKCCGSCETGICDDVCVARGQSCP